MMFSYENFDWIQRIIVPIMTAASLYYLYQYLVYKKIPGWLKLAIAGLIMLLPLIKSINLRFDDWCRSFITPILISLSLFLFFTLISLSTSGKLIQSNNEPLWLAVLSSVIIAPISEELLVRGVLFGFITMGAINMLMLLYDIAISKIFGKKMKLNIIRGNIPIFLVIVGIIAQGLFFGAQHDNESMFSLVSRATNGIVYGLLFYFNNRNLYPSIISHATWNLLIVATNPVPIF